MAQWTPQQLQQMAALLQGTHNQLAVDNALRDAPTQRWAVDAEGRRVDPYSANAAVSAIDQAAPNPGPTAPAMGYAPQTQTGMAAPPPQAPQPSQVAGRMTRNPLFGTPAGSFLSMFGGKPQGGGLMALMGEIFRSRPSAPRTGSVAEMERKHSGGSSYSGGPAVGGEYASGGR